MTNADEALGKDVLRKPANELNAIKMHDFMFVIVVIALAEGDSSPHSPMFPARNRWRQNIKTLKALRIFVNLSKISAMSAIVIKTDNQNTKILTELAKKLGADVFNINEDQFEDLALGIIMDKVKTGETVSRDSIMNKLEKK